MVRQVRSGLFWVTALCMAALAVWRIWSLGSGASDLGFTVHALGAVARGGLGAPASWAGWTFLQDHFAPWLLPLAPLVATPWGGYLLVIAQALAYGVSMLLVWRLIQGSSFGRSERGLLLVGYAFAPALLFPLLFDVHSNVIAAPFLVLVLDGLIHDRRREALLAAIAAVGLREDVALLVGVLAVLYFPERRWSVVRLGVPAGLALIGWRIASIGTPRTGYTVFYGYLSIDRGSADLPSILEGLAKAVWADGYILLWLLAVLLPWVFWRPLGARPIVALFIAGFPYLAANSLLAKSVGFHYWALTPALMVAAVIEKGSMRLSRARWMMFVTWLGVVLLGGPIGFGTLGPGGTTVASIARGSTERSDVIKTAHEALACVPRGQSAALISQLTPLSGHLSEVHLLPHPFAPVSLRHGRVELELAVVNPVWPEWVIGSDLPEAAQGHYELVTPNPMLWRSVNAVGSPSICT